MKKTVSIFILLIVSSVIGGCNSDDEELISNTQENWFPLEIGNYWKKGEFVHYEIVDTLRIDDELFYKMTFQSSYDTGGIHYFRIDENHNLIERFPDYPDSKELRAKFAAQVGETFYQNDNQPGSDFLGTVMERTDSLRVFRFQRVNHPTLVDEHTDTYINGLGWWYDWDEIKIGSNTYYF